MKQETYEALKKAGFDVEGTLKRLLGNEEFYLEVLKKYAMDKNCELLENCFLAEKYKDAFLAAHALKGVAKNLGMDGILAYLEPLVELLRKPTGEEAWKNTGKEYLSGLLAVQKDVVALLENLE